MIMSLNRYIDQLIEEIRACARNLPQISKSKVPVEGKEIEYLREWENVIYKPMMEWFNIEKDAFPEESLLSDEQINRLFPEFINLWKTFNFSPDLPAGLPERISYKVMREQLDKEVAWVSRGIIHIEFCNYDPKNCPFPQEYCMCKDFENRDKQLSENQLNIARVRGSLEIIKSDGTYLNEEYIFQDIYIKQLQEDLEDAKKRIDVFNEKFDLYNQRISFSEFGAYTSPFLSMEELTGMSKDLIPEYFNLHNYYIHKLLISILEVLDVFDIQVLFPAGVPPEIFYEVIRDEWNTTKLPYMPYGGSDFDYCKGKDDCPFKMFCECDHAYEMEDETDTDLSDSYPPEINDDTDDDDDELDPEDMDDYPF